MKIHPKSYYQTDLLPFYNKETFVNPKTQCTLAFIIILGHLQVYLKIFPRLQLNGPKEVTALTLTG